MLIHLKDGSEQKSVTPVKCSLCKKGFKTWEGVKMHLTKKHLTNGGEVKCLFVFTYRMQLQYLTVKYTVLFELLLHVKH